MVKKLFKHRCGLKRNGQKQGCASSQNCRISPLSEKNKCGPARVCRVNGDRKHCARLASLGLYPGNEIELVSPSNGDRCIVKVHGGTISIDRDTTENILITE